jgi:deoxycytidine triphosphate deaminase
MKKLIFITLFFYPAFLFSQQQVTLKSGMQFEGFINRVSKDNLLFYQNIDEIGSKKVDISLITAIAGEFENSTKKALIKRNPEIVFTTTYVKPEKYYTNNEYEQMSLPVLTSGDLIKRSSVLRLSGLALSTATATAIWAGALGDDYDTQKTVAIAAGVVSLGLYIAGEITLFKAGKLHNKEAVTLTPASQGIGMAINF